MEEQNKVKGEFKTILYNVYDLSYEMQRGKLWQWIESKLSESEKEGRRKENDLKLLSNAVKKFLEDISSVPPWESVGAIWADKIKQLHTAYWDINFGDTPMKELNLPNPPKGE